MWKPFPLNALSDALSELRAQSAMVTRLAEAYTDIAAALKKPPPRERHFAMMLVYTEGMDFMGADAVELESGESKTLSVLLERPCGWLDIIVAYDLSKLMTDGIFLGNARCGTPPYALAEKGKAGQQITASIARRRERSC